MSIIRADARQIPLADESVNLVVCSPPYWSLRDYQTGRWEGGAGDCDHAAAKVKGRADYGFSDACAKQATNPSAGYSNYRDECSCGARRIDLQIGLERSIDAYIQTLVGVFEEVRRVLHPSGVCFVNIASSYISGTIKETDARIRRNLPDSFRLQVAEALLSVWSLNASGEQALRTLLQAASSATRQLLAKELRGVRNGNAGSQVNRRARARQVLLAILQGEGAMGTTDSQASADAPAVPTMRSNGGTPTVRIGKEHHATNVLRDSMLVRVQSTGESLSVGGRPARTAESRRDNLAQGSQETRSESLSNMLGASEPRSPSYSTAADSQGTGLGRGQRDNALRSMPSSDGAGRDEICVPSADARRRFCESLTVDKIAIPDLFEFFFESVTSPLKPKDDALIPERLAIALQESGWYIRSRIAWCKPAPMPESCVDRPTTAWEHLWVLAKNANYFWDAEAVREPQSPHTLEKLPYGRRKETAWKESANGAGIKSNESFYAATARAEMPNGRNLRNWWVIGPDPSSAAYCVACDLMYERAPKVNSGTDFRHGAAYTDHQAERDNSTISAGPRCVRCRGKLTAHYAAYPRELVRRCIAAGSSERGVCAACGMPWVRVTERVGGPPCGSHRLREDFDPNYNKQAHANGTVDGSALSRIYAKYGYAETQTLGWRAQCQCNAPIRPALILDPFSGTGTTLLVARDMGRRAVGLELSWEYAKYSRRRLAQGGLFTMGRMDVTHGNR